MEVLDGLAGAVMRVSATLDEVSRLLRGEDEDEPDT
jgi:hypothetical protein